MSDLPDHLRVRVEEMLQDDPDRGVFVAIKLVRDETGLGLREAKAHVFALQPPPPPSPPPTVEEDLKFIAAGVALVSASAEFLFGEVDEANRAHGDDPRVARCVALAEQVRVALAALAAGNLAPFSRPPRGE